MNKQHDTFVLKQYILIFYSVISILCSGCSFSYLLHAARGQYSLLKDSIEIEEALEDDSVPPKWKENLILIREVKEFGENELGMKKTQNYETVYLRSNQAPIYMVSACPKDKLSLITYWYPIVGNMPYLGYFDHDTAKKKRDQLLDKDLDVYMGIADAYSTLGWFKDPVTLNVLEQDTLDLIETILHEMTHTTFYIKGQWEFNEGLANLMGKYGSLAFVKAKYGIQSPISIRAMNIIDDELMFSALLSSLFERLEELYNSPLSYINKLQQREKIFEEFLVYFKDNKNRFRTDRFVSFGSNGLDNAYLMIIGLYHKNFHMLSKVLEKKGISIKNTIHYFMDIGKENDNMLERIKIIAESPSNED